MAKAQTVKHCDRQHETKQQRSQQTLAIKALSHPWTSNKTVPSMMSSSTTQSYNAKGELQSLMKLAELSLTDKDIIYYKAA